MNTFDDFLAQVDNNDLRVDSSWAQGRSVFGGLSAALLLHYMQSQSPIGERKLRTVNVHFSGALLTDEPCQFEHEIISEGKSVLQVQGRLSQNGKICTLITACYAIHRQSNAIKDATLAQPAKSAAHSQAFAYIPGITPNFVQHTDMRLSGGNFPFSGSDDPHIKGWMAFKQAPKTFDEVATVALIDVWPLAIMNMVKTPCPGSSITWNLEFIQPVEALQADDYLYYECDVMQAQLGYGHSEAKVYHPNGQLLALSRQLMSIYDVRSNK